MAQDGKVNRVIQFLIFRTFDLRYDYDFGVLLVPSVLHLGALLLLYQSSSVPYENAVLYSNLSIFVLGLVAFGNIFDY